MIEATPSGPFGHLEQRARDRFARVLDAPTDVMARLFRLESESAVRRVVARYFKICDRLGPDAPLDELGMLFTPNATWEGKGRYKEAFGAYHGREAIVAMIARYCAPVPHFAMTGHFFSAEHVEVDGDTACGDWMMLQCSTYTDGVSDLRSACLRVLFAFEDGDWRISRFTSENIFSRRVDTWSDADPIPVPHDLPGASQ